MKNRIYKVKGKRLGVLHFTGVECCILLTLFNINLHEKFGENTQKCVSKMNVEKTS